MTDTTKFVLVLLMTLVLITVFVTLGMFGHRIEQITPYEVRVNRILERNGGFTNRADSQITKLTNKYGILDPQTGEEEKGTGSDAGAQRNIFFNVRPVANNESKKLPYGAEINYVIAFKTPVIPMTIPSFTHDIGMLQVQRNFTASTTSKVGDFKEADPTD